MRIVIVGAGLGGLVAALSLRKRGFSVQVLEQSSTLGEIGAGIQTAPNASKILFQLGLRDHLESIHTEPQDQVRRRWRDGSIVASTPLGKELQHRFGAPYWHYHRADLHKLLVEQCVDPNGPGEPVEIFTSTRVVAVHDDDPAQPAVSSLDGRRFSGDLVIGADGIKSKVRDLIGAPDTLRFSGEMAYRVLIPGELIRADPATRFLVDRFHSTIWYGPDRHLVHYMISGGDILNLVAIVPATAGIDAGVAVAPVLPGISDRPEQLREVVRAAREAGATGIWANLLFLRPGTREHFLEHLAEDWPEQLPLYERLYAGRRAYLGAEERNPLRAEVSKLARELGIRDRRTVKLAPPPEPEQLSLSF